MLSTTNFALVPLDSEPGAFALYAWQNILFACWSQRATGPAVARVALARETMAREHPEGVSVIYLIAENAGLPTPEARAGVMEMMARYRNKRACLALLIQGGGFWASAMRGAIIGVRLLVPGQFPMLISGEVAEIAAWLPEPHQQHTKTPIDSAALSVLLRQLEATL